MAFPADQYRWDIHSRGREATLVRKGTTATNPNRPWDGQAASDPDLSTDLVIKFKPVRQTDIDGDRVLETDEIAQIYAPDLPGRAPLIGDQVVVDGESRNVMATATRQHRGKALRYDLRVRA